LELAVIARNNYFLIQGKTQRQCLNIPTGVQAVPNTDPIWDTEDTRHDWERNYFIYCVTEGLRRVGVKSLNYPQVIVIQQGDSDTPVTFLQRLEEALQKQTNVEGKLKGRSPS
jgi:hypothetical protein